MSTLLGKIDIAKSELPTLLTTRLKSFVERFSVEPDAEKPDLRVPLCAGIAVVGVFLGVFGVWAATAPLKSGAIAPGTVKVEGNRKTIQHLEGGIVGEILVRDGETVEAGQVLLRLDQTQPRATLDLLRKKYWSDLALAARLKAERDGLESIEYPPELLDNAKTGNIIEILVAQEEILSARRAAIAGQTAILNQRIAQLHEEIGGLEEQIQSETRQISIIQQEIDDVGSLVEKGLAPKPRLLELQRQYADIEGNRGQNRAGIARAQQGIGEARIQIEELTTGMRNEVVSELREVQDRIYDSIERLRAAEDVLGRTEIKAPLAGIIVNMLVHTPGGVVGPGEPLMDIVPSGDRLLVEAQIDPADIDIVYPGLTTQVRLTALSQRNSVPLDGILEAISADHMTDEQTGAPYFLGRVTISGEELEKLDGAVLYPGMQTEVIIVTGERTPLDYLLKPLTSSFNRAMREE